LRCSASTSGSEIAVAGKDHVVVDMFGEFQRVDRQLDVHIALDLAAAGGVGELLRRLGHDLVAIVVEPVDQRPDRGIFLIFDQRRVIIGAQQIAALLEIGEQLAVVDVEAERREVA
jgi:hypothetical protein